MYCQLIHFGANRRYTCLELELRVFVSEFASIAQGNINHFWYI